MINHWTFKTCNSDCSLNTHFVKLHLIDCRTDKGFFCNTFFNETVDVVDRPRLIDTQLMFLIFIGLSVLGAIGKALRFLSPLLTHVVSNHSYIAVVPWLEEFLWLFTHRCALHSFIRCCCFLAQSFLLRHRVKGF